MTAHFDFLPKKPIHLTRRHLYAQTDTGNIGVFAEGDANLILWKIYQTPSTPKQSKRITQCIVSSHLEHIAHLK